MARWVIAVVGDAPCQCRLPGGIHTTSPGRISSTGPPSICTRPTPAVTMSVCPSGWVCHALRALGSNVTYAPDARVDSFAWNSGSMRTEPVKYSAGAFCEGCIPARAIESETTVAAATMFISVLSSTVRRSTSRAQQRLDCAALVHRAVALRHPVERQAQVEDLAGVDLPA